VLAASFLRFWAWPLGWVAFLPILLAISLASGSRQTIRVGIAAGLTGNIVAFYWLVGTIHSFGGFPLPIAAFFYFVLSLFGALQFVLLALALRFTGPGPLALSAPVLWVTLEFWYPNLFLWRLAYSQLEMIPLLQIGELTGPFGLSFVMVWFCSALVLLILRGWSQARGAIVGVAAAIVGLVAFGLIRLPDVDRMLARAEPVRVGIVQGNLTIEEKGNLRYFRTNVRTYGALTREIAPDVDVVIWPESVITEPLSRSLKVLPARVLGLLGTRGPLLTGALTWEGSPANPDFFNSVLLIADGGKILGRSDKQILMPFGEYFPFASVFPMLRAFSPQTGNFQAGSRVEILDVPGAGRFAPLNCYEDLKASIARYAVQDGAEVLFAVANDGWFGDTEAPWQHEALALWRAVENRRFLIRVTNTGVTDVIDPAGRVRRRLPVFAAASMVETVRRLNGRSLYSRVGDLFAWVVTWVAVAQLLRAWGRRRRGHLP
jgi:apolipoprotein N-acyltransferase